MSPATQSQRTSTAAQDKSAASALGIPRPAVAPRPGTWEYRSQSNIGKQQKLNSSGTYSTTFKDDGRRRSLPPTNATLEASQQRANNYNSGMMLDLDAPIIPGKSAGGVILGSFVGDLLKTVRPQCTTKLPNGEKYDLGAVKVWTENAVITQTGTYSGYRGTLHSSIRVGSTIADVEDSFGCSVEEDEHDNLIVPNSYGWCFETEQYKHSHHVRDNRNARIVAIFVFSPQADR